MSNTTSTGTALNDFDPFNTASTVDPQRLQNYFSQCGNLQFWAPGSSTPYAFGFSGYTPTTTAAGTWTGILNGQPAPDTDFFNELVTAIQTFGLRHKRDCPFEKCNCGVVEIEQKVANHLGK